MMDTHYCNCRRCHRWIEHGLDNRQYPQLFLVSWYGL